MQGKQLTDIKGVGQARLKKLTAMGIDTIDDLLQFLPAKYYDLTAFTDLSAEVYQAPGSMVFLPISVSEVNTATYKYKRYISAQGLSGTREVTLLWFNNPHALRGVKKGDKLVAFGALGKSHAKFSSSSGLSIINPILEHAGKVQTLCGIMPIYKLSAGIGKQTFGNIVAGGLAMGNITSAIDAETEKGFGLMPLYDAYNAAHFPKSMQAAAAAERRIVVELLVRRYLNFYLQNRTFYGAQKPHGYIGGEGALKQFTTALNFTLTPSQSQAISEIYNDLSGITPANRILIGDVGSGKTVVALAAAYLAAISGGQCVFMAPTEILARQHFNNADKIFSHLGISAALLTSSLTQNESQTVLEDIESGKSQVIFATHSAVSERVKFKDLRLAICDEQQRFGVGQRKALMDKGYCPDMLFLSATPVPRTLSLALFGEMQISYIHGRAAGSKVNTYLVPQQKSDDMFNFICQKLKESGGQAYVICRHIDGQKDDQYAGFSETYEDLSVNKLYLQLKKTHFKHLHIDKLHGRMDSAKKDAAMQRFYGGQTDVLIATTLIEVGIDVARANIIAIMDADKYGLSQLHQLRGRVGRGSLNGHCYLVYGGYTENARERLLALKQTDDGLALAHKDLEIRGAGDFLSEKQHGGGQFAAGKKVEYDDIKFAMDICRHIIDSGKVKHKNYDVFTSDMKKIALN